MLMVSYNVDKTAKEARDELAKGYGDDASVNDSTFPALLFVRSLSNLYMVAPVASAAGAFARYQAGI